MPRALVDPKARMLNHAEFVYPPGGRARARRLFEALGLSVIDPQTDPVPEILGPAAGPYLIVRLDPACEDVIDNVFYASEVPAIQWSFEERIAKLLAADAELAQSRAELLAQYQSLPQAMTHLGIAFPSVEALDASVEALAGDPELAGHVDLSPVYRPGQEGSVDDRVVQAFVHTDLCSTGLLCVGQQFELQVRLDQ